MKFKLYKELLDRDDIMSHVFLNTCPPELVEKIAKENEGMDKEDVEKREIEIELKIGGEVVDVKKFFGMLKDQYSGYVEREATEIVKNQTSEALKDMHYKIEEVTSVLEGWSKEVNWDVPNPFGKTLYDKYKKRLNTLKEERANSVDENTDAENELYDKLIELTALICRDLANDRCN